MKHTINIKGMTCNACVKRIEKKVFQLKGVEKVKVDLTNNKATVNFDEKKVSLNQIKEEITDLGYKLEGKTAKKKSFWQGLMYGLIPHIGCIAFIIGSIFRVHGQSLFDS